MHKQKEIYKAQFRESYSKMHGSVRMTEADLQAYTAKLSRNGIDQTIVSEIWERMKKDRDGSSNVDEFVFIFFEAESTLLAKQQEANRMLDDLRTQLKDIEALYDEAKEQETKPPSKFYRAQPKQQGKLQVSIDEISGFTFRQQGQQYFVKLTLGDQTQQTRANSVLKWNQVFNMYNSIIQQCGDR